MRPLRRIPFLRDLWDAGEENHELCTRLRAAEGSWKAAERRWKKTVKLFLGDKKIQDLWRRKKRIAAAVPLAVELLGHELGVRT